MLADDSQSGFKPDDDKVAWIEHDQVLKIDWTEHLGHLCELYVRGWSGELDVCVVNESGQEGLLLRDVGDWLFTAEDAPVAAWRRTIPDSILTAVYQLPTRRAEVLQEAVGCRYFEGLLTSNPLLVWLISDQWELDEVSLYRRNGEIEKQTTLAALVGLTGAKQQVRLLKRLAGLGLNDRQIRRIPHLLEAPGVCDCLSHLREIDVNCLEVLGRFPWLVAGKSRSLISQLSDPHLKRILEDTCQMAVDPAVVLRCSTPRALHNLHDRLVAEVNAQTIASRLQRGADGEPLALPRPPIEGNGDIEAITSQLDIIEEGRQMRHCISSYIPRVISGTYYVYRMIKPSRLTIGVKMNKQGAYALGEVRGKCNAEPNDESRELVEDWFADSISRGNSTG